MQTSFSRLVYPPKAYIYIRSSNQNGTIYDVSDDVTRVSVTQNIGDVSTANFELRNRYRKWLRAPNPASSNQEKELIFLPMDLVTIFLQRIPGRPIQTFTGYLDSVPYLQAYPGNALFEATCTLKKLAYTWFDPGLQYFYRWLQSMGWAYDPTTGQTIVPQAISAITNDPATHVTTDSGFGHLLARFMVDIAGWDPSKVFIGSMNPDLPKIATSLWRKIDVETQAQTKELTAFFGAALSMRGWSAGDSATTAANSNPAGDSSANVYIPPVTSPTLELIDAMKAGQSSAVPLAVLITAALALTDMNQNYSISLDSGDPRWGYGLYAMRPVSPFGGWLAEGGTIGGYTLGSGSDSILDATNATRAFSQALNSDTGTWAQAARAGDLASVRTWIEHALGYTLPADVNIGASYREAQTLAGTTVADPITVAPASINLDPTSLTWTSSTITAIASDADKAIISQYYANVVPDYEAALFYLAKSSSTALRIAQPPGPGTNQVLITGTQSDLSAFFTSLIGTDINYAIFYNGATFSTLTNGVETTNTGTSPGLSNDISIGVLLTMTKAPAAGTTWATRAIPSTDNTKGVVPPASTSPNQTNAHSATWPDVWKASSAGSFAKDFAFPADFISANRLTGEKALMNDTSCLDGVKQFTGAALRTFRSLPDGSFLAFYPDYFGVYREAYWYVRDIEIINFGIQLSDEQLATHVYVTGDTTILDGQIDWVDQVGSHGVATVAQAAMIGSFVAGLTPEGSTTRVGRFADANAFLRHYGARPYDEEQPIIHNGFYEFLLAWQRFMQKWADQFITSIDLTFQPEIMAGGLVAFPDHNLQVYIESVTHTLDYGAGATTSCIVSAPSTPGQPKFNLNKSFSMPGMALGGQAVTVSGV